MMTWLPVVILAVAQITIRLTGVAAMIWQERARAKSHCAQMRTASASGAVLLERRHDGAGLVIVPQGLMIVARACRPGTAGAGWEEAPVA